MVSGTTTSMERGLGQPLRELKTSELLTRLLRAADLDADSVDELAQAIDSGSLRCAAETPDIVAVGRVMPFPAAAMLRVAFELTRRAGRSRPPTVLRGPADVATIAQRELGGLRVEQVLVIVCDAANRPMQTVRVAQGAANRAQFVLREILSAVLRWDGFAFALAHNHTSGSPEPSDADVLATQRVEAAARLMQLRFLGHVIVAKDRWAAVTTPVERTRD